MRASGADDEYTNNGERKKIIIIIIAVSAKSHSDSEKKQRERGRKRWIVLHPTATAFKVAPEAVGVGYSSIRPFEAGTTRGTIPPHGNIPRRWRWKMEGAVTTALGLQVTPPALWGM